MAYLITFYFIVLDFFTGLLKAFATGGFSSKIMRRTVPQAEAAGKRGKNLKTTLYEVTGKSGANLRELPSTDSKVVETLTTGAAAMSVVLARSRNVPSEEYNIDFMLIEAY